MSETWSDEKKWWMELLKGAISFTVAAFVSITLIDNVQANRQIEKARADAYYSARLKALEDFRAASVTYDLAAHTAYTELYQWKSKEKTPAMLKYEQEAYPRWLLALETLENLYPNISADTKLLDAKAFARHKLYDTLVDTRLDGIMTTPIDPWAKRHDFNSISEVMRTKRAELISKLQKSLFPALFEK
jgi:hypothetical protein